MLNKMMAPPKDVHILISGTNAYVTLCTKRNFANVIQLSILRQEGILHNFSVPKVVTRVVRREEVISESEKDV